VQIGAFEKKTNTGVVNLSGVDRRCHGRAEWQSAPGLYPQNNPSNTTTLVIKAKTGILRHRRDYGLG